MTFHPEPGPDRTVSSACERFTLALPQGPASHQPNLVVALLQFIRQLGDDHATADIDNNRVVLLAPKALVDEPGLPKEASLVHRGLTRVQITCIQASHDHTFYELRSGESKSISGG